MSFSQFRCLRTICYSYKDFLFKRTYKVGLHVKNMSSQVKDADNHLVWMDMEMTGLNTDIHHILEVSCVITDGDLNIVAEAPTLIIHQPPEVLEKMNEWCVKQHGESGLTEASKSSKLSLKEAEDRLLKFVKTHTIPGKSPLAGNSVWGDRMFLVKYMPLVNSHLHYRIVDVSSVKELCRRWFPKEYKNAPIKKLAHRSLDDIRESIEELKYYKKTIFNPAAESILDSVQKHL